MGEWLAGCWFTLKEPAVIKSGFPHSNDLRTRDYQEIGLLGFREPQL
jgi:hypothetical protein